MTPVTCCPRGNADERQASLLLRRIRQCATNQEAGVRVDDQIQHRATGSQNAARNVRVAEFEVSLHDDGIDRRRKHRGIPPGWRIQACS
jgi:hypothetical protein